MCYNYLTERKGYGMEDIKKGKTSVLPCKNCFAILVGNHYAVAQFPIRIRVSKDTIIIYDFVCTLKI